MMGAARESDVDRFQRMVIQALANPRQNRGRAGLMSKEAAELGCWLVHRDLACELMAGRSSGDKKRKPRS